MHLPFRLGDLVLFREDPAHLDIALMTTYWQSPSFKSFHSRWQLQQRHLRAGYRRALYDKEPSSNAPRGVEQTNERVTKIFSELSYCFFGYFNTPSAIKKPLGFKPDLIK